MLVYGAKAYSMELFASIARPFTPSLCPPFWFASGRTAHVSRVRDKRCDSRSAWRMHVHARGRIRVRSP